MKTNLKFFFSFLVFSLFLVNSGFAQAVPEFKFGPTTPEGTLGGIELDIDSPLSNEYTMDISDTGWSETDAVNITNYIDNQADLAMLELDYSNSKITLKLATNAPQAANWSVEDWNTYFDSIN